MCVKSYSYFNGILFQNAEFDCHKMEPKINVCDPMKCDRLKPGYHDHEMSDSDLDEEVCALYNQGMKTSPTPIPEIEKKILQTSGTSVTKVSLLLSYSLIFFCYIWYDLGGDHILIIT